MIINYTPQPLGQTATKSAASEFDKQVSQVQPRFIDTYVLPGFLIWYAIKSTQMPKRARRILFISGVYAGYRSYGEYKRVLSRVAGALKQKGGSDVRSA